MGQDVHRDGRVTERTVFERVSKSGGREVVFDRTDSDRREVTEKKGQWS